MAMKNIQLQIQWLADNICNATATYQVTGPHGLLPSKERKFSDHQTLMTSYVIDFMMLHHNHPPPYLPSFTTIMADNICAHRVRIFKHANSLYRHIRTSHKDHRVTCSRCGNTYRRMEYLPAQRSHSMPNHSTTANISPALQSSNKRLATTVPPTCWLAHGIFQTLL